MGWSVKKTLPAASAVGPSVKEKSPASFSTVAPGARRSSAAACRGRQGDDDGNGDQGLVPGHVSIPPGRAGVSQAEAYLTSVPLDIPVQTPDALTEVTTRMSSEGKERVELLQGTLDLIVLRALETMGPQHAYGLAARLEQVAEPSLSLNQGTLYPALVRLEQRGFIKGSWQRTESNREAKYYAITRAGGRALLKETERWRRLAGLVDRLLLNES